MKRLKEDFSTPMNTPGVGNATPDSGDGGSGDSWTTVGIPYDQAKPKTIALKPRKKKKKLVSENLDAYLNNTQV